MKLIFKLSLCLWHTIASASMITILYTKDNKKNAGLVLEKFKKSYNIPSELIQKKFVYKCKSMDKRFMEVCVLKDGRLKIIENSNLEKIKSSLLVFNKGVSNV